MITRRIFLRRVVAVSGSLLVPVWVSACGGELAAGGEALSGAGAVGGAVIVKDVLDWILDLAKNVLAKPLEQKFDNWVNGNSQPEAQAAVKAAALMSQGGFSNFHNSPV